MSWAAWDASCSLRQSKAPAVGAMMVGVETMKTESAGTVSSDEITLGAQYTLAPGAVAFIENTTDDKTASEKTTAMGIAIKF